MISYIHNSFLKISISIFKLKYTFSYRILTLDIAFRSAEIEFSSSQQLVLTFQLCDAFFILITLFDVNLQSFSPMNSSKVHNSLRSKQVIQVGIFVII